MSPKFKKILFQNKLLHNLHATAKFYQFHKRLPQSEPVSFNDIIHKVKIEQTDNVLRQFIADKEFVKLYVKSIVGDTYNIPTIAVLKSKAETQEFLEKHTQDEFIFKPTHMSGKYEFVTTKATEEQIKEALSWFDINYGDITGERVYCHLEKKIIVEPLINFDGRNLPFDYKIFCYHGKPQFIQVDAGRNNRHLRTLYSNDWQKLPFTLKVDSAGDIPKPKLLNEMLEIASKLSMDFDFIRVDMYVNDNQIYIGELTNMPENGHGQFDPVEMDFKIGEIMTDPRRDISELV